MAFVPFRNITNRGAAFAVAACVVLSAAYVKLDEAVERKREERRASGAALGEDGWPRRR